MPIYRGPGGASETTDQATITAVQTAAAQAASSATAAASSATTASNNASAAASSASTASGHASTAAGYVTSAANQAAAAVLSAAEAEGFATDAEGSAEEAASSASAASGHATAANDHMNNAETYMDRAEAAAEAAAGYVTDASGYADDAAASAVEAASYVDTVAASVVEASGYADDASGYADAAAASAVEASGYADDASGSATAAAGSASAASASADAALSALDSFDDRYLGQKSVEPTVDNDGNPLVAGALYFNTVDNAMKVYDGSQWLAAYASLSGALIATNNLSDLVSASSARTNLGLGTAATTDSTAYATAAQGALADSAVQPGDLATVATSGSYTDLSNKPTLGTAAATDSTAYATAAQGSNADTAYGWGNHASAGYASDADVVKLTGDQTVAGTKTFSSNPTLSGGTANGVAYLNGSKVVTTGSALTFDGTNLGLGVTPSSNTTDYKVFEFGTGGNSLAGWNNASVPLAVLTSNAYRDGATWKYKVTNKTAVQFITNANDGNFIWSIAPIGTAGNAISFTERMRIDSSGNLGLGVTPSAWGTTYKAFEMSYGSLYGGSTSFGLSGNSYFNGTNSIYKTTAAASQYSQAGGQHIWFTAPSGTAGNAISFTQAMTLDASGNLGVGTTSPSAKLEIAQSFGGGNGVGLILNDFGSSGANEGMHIQWRSGIDKQSDQCRIGQISNATGSGSNLAFYTNGADTGTATERARIDSSGNFGIGTASPSYKLHVSGDIYATGNVTAYSDRTLKDNIKTVDNALGLVSQMRGVTYTRKDTGEAGVGVIAQEMQEVLPEVVMNKDGVMGVAYGNIVGVLIEAIKEQSAQIAELRAEIQTLKGE